MKKMINLLIGMLVWASLSVFTSGDSIMTNELNYLDKTIVIEDQPSVRRGILQASERSGMAFCLESLRGADPDTDRKLPLGGQNPISLKSIVLVLEQSGYRCRKYGKAVLISTPGVRSLKVNPLDTPLDGFVFEGDHEAFVEKISSGFPGIRPSVLKISGSLRPELRYKVDIKGSTTIRDVLMEVSSLYGVMWRAEISEKSPSYEIKGPDGSVVHAQANGTAVLLTFQSIR